MKQIENEKGGILIIILVLGIMIAGIMYVISLTSTTSTDGGQPEEAGASQTGGSSQTPIDKAKDAVDATQKNKDRTDEIKNRLEGY